MRLGLSVIVLAICTAALAQHPADPPRLGDLGFTQEDIAAGNVSLSDIRHGGMKVFATPFNKSDGYGDGPVNPDDTTFFGGRPTLQNNGTFLRINGLDGQTCVECHFMGSNAVVPVRFAVGGFAGAVSSAMFMPRNIDVSDQQGNGFADYDGRFINPPFLFGSGGIELLGKEMTADLQRLRAEAEASPETWIDLETKGVSFGQIRYIAGAFDVSRVEGIDDDLIVRPFGRKGEFPTTRSFDLDALRFHFGMEPIEVVGVDFDNDGDGVINEIGVGEVSALAIFNTTLPRPEQVRMRGDAQRGQGLFHEVGCAECHIPSLTTTTTMLSYSFPEIANDPSANVFYEADLSKRPARFDKTGDGGLVIPLFADLKRHDMGPALAESFGSDLDHEFTTARLWGVADTAPYMHDGRALTIRDAILLHGGEAQAARDAFAALDVPRQNQLLAFLNNLRTPDIVRDPK